MSMYEDISVIPLYIGFVRIYDSELDHTWDEQVFVGISYTKALAAVRGALKDGWPKTATVQGLIKHFQIQPNGEVSFLTWEGDIK